MGILENKVTVIIPYYNSKNTINRALNSLHVQTLLPSEVIIVNDFSDEHETEKICEKLMKTSWNFKLNIIHLPKNMGPGVARNIGWNHASGSYVAFLDADDSWNPLKLEIQINAMIKYNACFSFHDLTNYENKSDLTDSGIDIINFKLINNLLFNKISTSSVVILSSIKERFPNQKYSEDYSLWLQILNLKYKTIYIKKPLTYIYKHHYLDSGLSSNLVKMELGEIRSYSKLAQKNILLIPLVLCVIFFSILKFMKRLMTKIFRI